MTPEEGHWGERMKVMLLSLGDKWAIDSMFTRRQEEGGIPGRGARLGKGLEVERWSE